MSNCSFENLVTLDESCYDGTSATGYPAVRGQSSIRTEVYLSRNTLSAGVHAPKTLTTFIRHLDVSCISCTGREKTRLVFIGSKVGGGGRGGGKKQTEENF